MCNNRSIFLSNFVRLLLAGDCIIEIVALSLFFFFFGVGFACFDLSGGGGGGKVEATNCATLKNSVGAFQRLRRHFAVSQCRSFIKNEHFQSNQPLIFSTKLSCSFF